MIPYTKSVKLISLCLPLFIVGCSGKNKFETISICSETKKPCLKGKAKIKFHTSKGQIVLEIDGKAAPITAGNFLELVNKKAYVNTNFHRVIKTPYPFIIQGGDINKRYSSSLNKDYRSFNLSYNESNIHINNLIPLEIKLKDEKLPRYNFLITNPNELSKLQLSHKRGSLAMARSEGVNSGSTQFYITLKALPELDGRFSVFGKVIQGMEIVDSIEQGDKILKTYLLAN
tara:strand:- start:31 stop:720 length:690 start_codon:yes stop_codon:yes gene_type:complete